MLDELRAAFMLLTRLPVGRPAPVPLARIVWAFPVVGAALGAFGGAAYALCAWAGLPPTVAAVWTLGAMLLASGAFHEDGLADTADGFGGGGTRDAKLAIMRDSRIGSFGALALMLSLAARGTAVVALARPASVATALIAAACLGRAAMLVALLLLDPARTDGLAAALRERSAFRLAAGLATASLVTLALLPPGAGLRAIAGACATALALSWTARVQLGGYTGDVLGAVCVLAECAALGAITIP